MFISLLCSCAHSIGHSHKSKSFPMLAFANVERPDEITQRMFNAICNRLVAKQSYSHISITLSHILGSIISLYNFRSHSLFHVNGARKHCSTENIRHPATHSYNLSDRTWGTSILITNMFRINAIHALNLPCAFAPVVPLHIISTVYYVSNR